MSNEDLPRQFVHHEVHSCMKSGYHKLGQVTYLEQKNEKFVRMFIRHCKYCSYVFAGGIEVMQSGRIRVRCLNETSEDKIVEDALTTDRIVIDPGFYNFYKQAVESTTSQITDESIKSHDEPDSADK